MHGPMLGRWCIHQKSGDGVGLVYIVWKKVQEAKPSHEEKRVI